MVLMTAMSLHAVTTQREPSFAFASLDMKEMELPAQVCILSIFFQLLMGLASSLVPSPPRPSFCLAAMEKKRALFLHGCETKAGVGRTGNEATS